MARFFKKTFRLGLLVSGAAALAYFLDPRNGRERRARAKDQAEAKLRRTRETMEKKERYAEGKAEGVIHTVADISPEPPADDKALADRIKSEVLGGDRFEGHQVVDVVDGVVTLRGEVTSATHVDELEAEVRKVPGVREVENLLHLPGTPAPNKQSSLGAS